MRGEDDWEIVSVQQKPYADSGLTEEEIIAKYKKPEKFPPYCTFTQRNRRTGECLVTVNV